MSFDRLLHPPLSARDAISRAQSLSLSVHHSLLCAHVLVAF